MPRAEPSANNTTAHTVTPAQYTMVNNLTVVIMTRGQSETVTETLSPNMVRTTVRQGPGSLTTTTIANGIGNDNNDNDNGNGNGEDNAFSPSRDGVA